MARHPFGGSIADYVITKGDDQGAGFSTLLTPGAVVTFYNAQTGGTQHTDLQDTLGGEISSAVADENGAIPQLVGPDGVWQMWADANGGGGPRRLVHSTDLGDATEAAQAQANQVSADLAALELGGLADVDMTGVADGDVPVFTTGVWRPGEGGGGASTLDGLADVESAAATEGQQLALDFDGVWRPVDPAAGSGTVTSINGEAPDASGDVALSAADVNALPDSFTAPVSSVDGRTGAVSLSDLYDAEGSADAAEADAVAHTNALMGETSRRVRNTDGTWPARHPSSRLDEAFEWDFAAPAFPPDAVDGDVYVGPAGMV